MKALNELVRRFDALPPWAKAASRAVISLGVGMVAALVLSYVLYRVGLPSKPFIYVAF